jgi:hypothetical protein
MKVNKPLVLVASVSVLAVFVAVRRSYEQRPARQQSSDATSSPDETSRMQVAALAATLGAASHHRAAEAVDPAPPAEPGSATGQGEDAESIREHQAAHVDSVFAGQTDAAPAWARDSERALGQTLRQLPGGATLESLECRSSLCRARLTHENQARFSEFIDHMIESTMKTWNGAIYSSRDAVAADGVIRNSIYFSKEGTEIPML